jgi:hypothetical protein
MFFNCRRTLVATVNSTHEVQLTPSYMACPSGELSALSCVQEFQLIAAYFIGALHGMTFEGQLVNSLAARAPFCIDSFDQARRSKRGGQNHGKG